MDSATFPFIVYAIRNNQPTNTKTGPSEMDSITVVLKIVATDYATLSELGDACRTAFDYQKDLPEDITKLYFESENFEYDDDFQANGLYVLNQQYLAKVRRPSTAVITEFIFNVDTRITSSTSTGITDFALPLISAGTYDFNVDWGDNTNDDITAYNQSEVTHRYTTGGEYKITISGTLIGFVFNNGGDARKMKDIENWGVLNINGPYSFSGCRNMTCSATDSPTISTNNLTLTFRDCFSFNGDLSNWDVSSVENFSTTFYNCVTFNQPLNDWDVRSATRMDSMFYGCFAFNQDLNNWNTSNVNNMTQTFMNCFNFNGNVSTWNTELVTNMRNMFYNAYPINKDLSAWKIGAVTNGIDFMRNIDGLSTTNYDALLISWSQQTPNSLSINFGGSKYTGGGTAEAARNTLINTYGWTIIDGGTA
jgi:surface protein